MSDAALAVPAAPADNTPAPVDTGVGGSLLGSAREEPAPAPLAETPVQTEAPAKTGTWRDGLPEDLRSIKSLEKFDTVEGLAKSYANLERTLGTDKIPIPKDPDDKASWEAYYKAGGRPDKAEDYKIERPADLPEGMTYNEQDEAFLKTFAHENGWNQRQFESAYKAFYEHQAKSVAAFQHAQVAQREEAERALQREGNREEVVNLAQAVSRKYIDQAALEKLHAAGLSNDPVIIRMFAGIGKDLAGHQVLKGRGGETVTTREQLTDNIAEFRERHKSALYDKMHPEHDMRVREMKGMFERLHPEQR